MHLSEGEIGYKIGFLVATDHFLMPEPTYEEACGSFVTVFHNPKQDQVVSVGKEKSREKGGEKSREKILALIGDTPEITTQEMSAITGLSIKGIEKILKNLKNTNMLRRVGPDKGGHWEVVK